MIYPHERLDDLQCNGYKLIQDPKGFCFGVDAVHLANFTKIKKGETVLDLCTGSGVIPILLCAKNIGPAHSTGLEIQPLAADRARRSVELNGLSDRITIDCGDVKNGADIYPPRHFDVVTVNPPYMNSQGGLLNESSEKAIARHEIACSLADVIGLAARVLKTGGRLYMVHRPQRLADIFCTLRRANFEPKTMQMLQSAPGKEPRLVLIEAIDHGKPLLRVLPSKS